jgi:large subunit ribosomal protein L6
MSRIGKQPIAIPPKVKVEIKGQKVLVEGPKGKLNWDLPKRTSLKVQDGKIVVSRDGDDAQARALHGLSRALVNNMVKGVADGFIKKLEIQGVGFKAAGQGKVGNLSRG